MKVSVAALAIIAAIVFFSTIVSVGFAQDNQEGIVETRILDIDPQAGVKSQHFYFIDFKNKEVTGSFSTGSTKINLGVVEFDVGSIRDNFVISDVKFDGDLVTFNMSGTTASGSLVTPDIDYRLSFSVTRSGKVSVGGCHDAYPAYLIQHNEKTSTDSNTSVLTYFLYLDLAINRS